MDDYGNPAPAPDGPASWGPAPWLSSLTLLAMLAALVWRLVDQDPENRVVATALIVVFAVVTLALVRIRVRLRVIDGGIAVTGPVHRRSIAWSQIDSIAMPTRGRFGRRATMLEMELRQPGEADDELLTFGRFDLGADPERVGRELQRRRAAAR